MRFIRGLDKKERARKVKKKTEKYIKEQNSEGKIEKVKKTTPHHLKAQQRAQKKSRSSIHSCPIVYTRDLSSFGNDVSLVSSGVKRKSINRAERKLENLKARRARPRRIKRAETVLAFRRSVDEMRKERENAK